MPRTTSARSAKADGLGRDQRFREVGILDRLPKARKSTSQPFTKAIRMG